MKLDQDVALDLAAVLARGPLPDGDKPCDWLVGLNDFPNPTHQIVLTDTTVEHFPDLENPTHVIFRGRGSVMVVEYHSMEFCTAKFDPARVPTRQKAK